MRAKRIYFLFLACSSLLASDWNQWLGPHRNGTAPSFNLPEALPDALHPVWKTQVGQGYASPVVADNSVFILTGAKGSETVTSLTLDSGRKRWSYTYPVVFKNNQYAVKFGQGPFATPSISGNRVFTLGITGHLHCFDADTGKLIWQHKFEGTFDNDRHYTCGNSASPLVWKGLCIAFMGNETQGLLVAFDERSGKKKWSQDHYLPGYASPIITNLAGKTQMVTMTQQHVVGVDPLTGEILWEFPFADTWRQNISTPLRFGDSIIISGVDRKTTALTVRKEDGKWLVSPKWTNDEAVTYMSSPILVGGKIFGLSHKNKGQFFGLDADSGKTLWIGDGRMGENAGLAHTGDYLISLTTEARLTVLKHEATGYAPLKSYDVADSPTWAYPVLLGDGVLIKDQTSLALLSFVKLQAKPVEIRQTQSNRNDKP